MDKKQNEYSRSLTVLLFVVGVVDEGAVVEAVVVGTTIVVVRKNHKGYSIIGITRR